MKNFTILIALFVGFNPNSAKAAVYIWIELTKGTPVQVKLNQAIDFGNIAEGQMLSFKVFGSVSINQQVVIRHDDLAYAKVMEVCRKNRKTTQILLEIQGAKSVDGQMVSLYSAYITLDSKKGNNAMGTVITSFVKNSIIIES